MNHDNYEKPPTSAADDWGDSWEIKRAQNPSTQLKSLLQFCHTSFLFDGKPLVIKSITVGLGNKVVITLNNP